MKTDLMYRIEEDARMLIDAEELKSDKKRYMSAMKEVKRIATVASSVAGMSEKTIKPQSKSVGKAYMNIK